MLWPPRRAHGRWLAHHRAVAKCKVPSIRVQHEEGKSSKARLNVMTPSSSLHAVPSCQAALPCVVP